MREVGRGNGMEERSLEIGEVLRAGGRRWWRQEAGLHIFWKKIRESLSRLSDNESKLATNKTLGYDMLLVKLNMICTARFWIDSRCWKCLNKWIGTALQLSTHTPTLCPQTLQSPPPKFWNFTYLLHRALLLTWPFYLCWHKLQKKSFADDRVLLMWWWLV